MFTLANVAVFQYPRMSQELGIANKKWRDFKCDLKSLFFKLELSLRQNITNGCKHRIPPNQWADLCEIWYTQKAQV